jgi:hypothetical protein
VFDPGQTVTESLTEVADSSDFAIFVLTADDTLSARQDHPRSPRSNVIFEMGFLAGKIGLSRIFIVVADPERAVMPSDLAGVMCLELPTHQKSDLPASVALVTAPITRAIAELCPPLFQEKPADADGISRPLRKFIWQTIIGLIQWQRFISATVNPWSPTVTASRWEVIKGTLFNPNFVQL